MPLRVPNVDTVNEVKVERLDDDAYMIYVVTWIVINGKREAFNSIMHMWMDTGVSS